MRPFNKLQLQSTQHPPFNVSDIHWFIGGRKHCGDAALSHFKQDSLRFQSFLQALFSRGADIRKFCATCIIQLGILHLGEKLQLLMKHYTFAFFSMTTSNFVCDFLCVGLSVSATYSVFDFLCV